MTPSDERSTAVTRSNKLASPASLISTAHAVETHFECRVNFQKVLYVRSAMPAA